MKKLSFIISLIFLLGLSNIVQAQIDDKFFTVGVKGGVNFTHMSGLNNKDYPGKTKAEVEFLGGITADFLLSPKWAILTGLEYTLKDTDTGLTDINASLSLPYYRTQYLQIPIHAGYRVKLGEHSVATFHAGPYFAYAVDGHIKWKERAQNGDEVSRYINPFDKKMFDRFDYGLGAGVSFENKNFCLNIGYDLGLKNIAMSNFFYPDRPTIDTRGMSVHTRSLHVTIGWKFRQMAWYGITRGDF